MACFCRMRSRGAEALATPAWLIRCTVQHAIYYDPAAQGGFLGLGSKLQVKTAKDAKSGPVSATAPFSFVGIEDSYFAAAFLPGGKSSVEETTYADNVPDAKGADEQRVGVGVGGQGVNSFSLFVGPKDTDLLRKVDPKLEQVVDWGWFWFLAQPLFTALTGPPIIWCTTTDGRSSW